jgi:hypothetical protein
MLREAAMEEERRQNPRARVNWPVTIQTEEGTIERATYNISPDGAFIRGLSPLELNEVVDMTISGPDHPITVKARVVWSSNQIPPGEEAYSRATQEVSRWSQAYFLVYGR